MKINIAIDGPSAAGKSSIADILASRLSYVHLDTGAMYRAVAYYLIQNGLKLDDEEKIVAALKDISLKINNDGRVYINGEDVTDMLRTESISLAASDVSKYDAVRKYLVSLQQEIAASKGYILDGRDIGTVVLKDAEVKIYLVASSEERAKRRVSQNVAKGIACDYDKVLDDIKKRDYQDMHRAISPLTKAQDAIEIDTSDLTIDEVVDYILQIVNSKLA